jgi:hypothetical protein
MRMRTNVTSGCGVTMKMLDPVRDGGRGRGGAAQLAKGPDSSFRPSACFTKCIFHEGWYHSNVSHTYREEEERGKRDRQEERQKIDHPSDTSRGIKSVPGHNPQQTHYFGANDLASPVVLENFW